MQKYQHHLCMEYVKKSQSLQSRVKEMSVIPDRNNSINNKMQ